MGHGTNDQDRHRGIDEIQRIGRVVEEKDVGKAEHHAGDRHGQHGEELERRAAGAKALRLFDHISAGEDDEGAEKRRQQRQPQRITVRIPTAAIHQVEGIVLQAQAEVVRPEFDQRGILADGEDSDDEHRDKRTIRQADSVKTLVHIRRIGNGTRREQRHLSFLHNPVDSEGNQRGNEQDDGDHGSHLEILLADDLFIDIHRQHIVLAADDLWQAEIGNDEIEHHESRRHQAVTGARYGDRPERPPVARPERHGSLVKPRIGNRQRGHDDDHRVREGKEHRTDDDADRAVDRLAQEQSLDHALIAKQVDQGDARKQRRHEDRGHRDQSKDALEPHLAAVQRIGEAEGQADRDDRAERRDEKRVLN